MKRIDSANATAGNKFQDANPGSGQQATFFNASWCNNVQEELATVIEGTGATLDGTKFDQLRRAIFEMAHPIGSTYIDNIGTQNPQQILGYGTWVEFAKGMMIVGLDQTQTEFNAMGKTGGNKNHTNTVAEMASHNHQVYGDINTSTTGSGGFITGSPQGNEPPPVVSENTGGGNAWSIMNPYVVARVWKRTA